MANRAYTIQQTLVPSVTTILSIINKPHLSQWRGWLGNREADRQSRIAAEFGTQFHDLLHRYNVGEPVYPEVQFEPWFEAYVNWKDQNIEEIVAAEQVAFHPELQYAGTADLIAVLKGDDLPSVIDFKTSNFLGGDWGLQLIAYKRALELRYGPMQQRIVLRFPKKNFTKAIQHDFVHDESDWAAFCAAHTLWMYMEGPSTLTKPDLLDDF